MALDVSKPLRRWMTVFLSSGNRNSFKVDLYYEKLPNACYWCDMFDHLEKHCSRKPNSKVDDMRKPYGEWFQDGAQGPNYQKSQGRHFGLIDEPPSPPWRMVVDDGLVLDNEANTSGVGEWSNGGGESPKGGVGKF